MTETLNIQKVAYLESLGVEVQDYDSKGLSSSTVYFSSMDGDFEILFDEFDLDTPLEKIQEDANQFSCCGDILDKDYMLCPTCLEHC